MPMGFPIFIKEELVPDRSFRAAFEGFGQALAMTLVCIVICTILVSAVGTPLFLSFIAAVTYAGGIWLLVACVVGWFWVFMYRDKLVFPAWSATGIPVPLAFTFALMCMAGAFALIQFAA